MNPVHTNARLFFWAENATNVDGERKHGASRRGAGERGGAGAGGCQGGRDLRVF